MLIMTDERTPLGGFHDPRRPSGGAVIRRHGPEDPPWRAAVNGVAQAPPDEAAAARARLYGHGTALGKADGDGDETRQEEFARRIRECLAKGEAIGHQAGARYMQAMARMAGGR
jgi:hypothetical protein